MKRFILILILLFSLSSNTVAENLLPFQEDYSAIDRAAQSMFYVEVIGESGEPIATGSGFVAFNNMFITNYHVIEDAAALIIYSDNYQCSYKLTDVLAADKQNDIAILSFPDGINYNSLVLDPNSSIMRGQPVTAIGSPEGIINSVSNGIVSAFVSLSDTFSQIQFTAPISHGSSGGALFDSQGHVIGLIYAIHATGENMNYAIPIQYVIDLQSSIDLNASTKLWNFNSLEGYLEPPEEIFIQLNSSNQPELFWKNNPNATSYKIYRLNSSGQFGMIGEIPAVKFESIKSFIDTNPKFGEKNCYCIRTLGKSSSSINSDPVQIFVP